MTTGENAFIYRGIPLPLFTLHSFTHPTTPAIRSILRSDLTAFTRCVYVYVVDVAIVPLRSIPYVVVARC